VVVRLGKGRGGDRNKVWWYSTCGLYSLYSLYSRLFNSCYDPAISTLSPPSLVPWSQRHPEAACALPCQEQQQQQQQQQ
jgi:hypothetical protein